MSVSRTSAARRRPPYAVRAGSCVAVIVLLAACGDTAVTDTASRATPASSASSTGTAGAQAGDGRGGRKPSAGSQADGPPGRFAEPAPRAPGLRPALIPGLGLRTRGRMPVDARQALVVTGDSYDSSLSTAVLYTRDNPAQGWRAVTSRWPAHNGLNGWTDEHREGDLRTPTGVYGLTAAGGRFAAPNTVFPYEQDPAYTVSGEGFNGEPLEGSFDYVVAIDYNRTPGVSPLDGERPLGQERGGGIWLHVDHGGPTQGCVSLPVEHMKELLRLLDPRKNPVVVMGDAEWLER
ncbi:L,D-transpeptidase family protein [Streptomyces sp. NPDC001282]|uniref:L,D-transpeptidase family protein n=1 Tax=Streptomyces sp. NPDC001282 TaxID=3364557 RepID=UPI0036C3827E